MKVKTCYLIGTALDWAVSKAIGDYRPTAVPAYSSDWAFGGPIIDEMMKGASFFIEADGGNVHVAFSETRHTYSSGYGPTTLLAAMRCRVASKLGDDVEIPDDLI